MYKHLLILEFQTNRFFLALSLTVNLLAFLLLGSSGAETPSFIVVTLISFYVLLSIAASYASNEKRNRQYIQLPVNATQIFMAGWSFVLVWLLLQTCSWVLYGIVFESDFDNAALVEYLGVGIGTGLVVALISIGIDLFSFKPLILRWLYIVVMVNLFALAVRFDISVGMVRNETGFHVLPITEVINTRGDLATGVLFVLVFVFLNYLVFRNSDNYLG